MTSILISTGFASGLGGSGFISAFGGSGFASTLGSGAFTSPLGSADAAAVDDEAAEAADLLARGFVVPPFGLVAAAVGAGGASDFGASVLAATGGAPGAPLPVTGKEASAGGAAASAALGAASGLTAASVDGLGASVSGGCAPTDCGFSRSFAKVPSLPGH